MGCEDAIQYGALMLPLHIGRDNKAMKSAIEKHGLDAQTVRALYGGVICRIAMKPKLVSKPLVAGLVFLLMGGAFVWLENTFYQYLDEDGVLHESMFLPLGALFILIGIVMLIFAVAGKTIAVIRQRNS